ncbi:hypothetical protein LTR56_010737 [Elasticomyces elasticus]|nr:hypothetical protein LTR56_010737 [Elasticomyces elasticus]KAK3667761.1 hypothetical protein LTR22_001206 [Elasticomyces elasticus]KAK4932245.1 hypothetical protein LTR49_001542 [Elasticomyces elasticus]KAK5745584.1 hypothetical protein LTS12_023066 [Elasticomyces elasticus]
MATSFFRKMFTYNTRSTTDDATTRDPHVGAEDNTEGTSARPVVIDTTSAPSTPTSPRRGRPAKRLTSSKRISTKAGPTELHMRKPLTPTTKTAIAKERRHKLYTRKREQQAKEGKVLGQQATYVMVLRSGKKYRTLGGTRRS